jgi:GR25 family glycosyltransferase involved in LPS biosynthesis
MINFPCDEIYLLNLYEREDKFNKMKERLGYMGIDVIPFRVVKHPFQDKMVRYIKEISMNIMNGAVYSCTREHYTIIKSAYLRGLECIGIMEDDISFYRDIDEWEEHFNNLPEDWDILRINCLRGVEEECVDEDVVWIKTSRNLSGTGFYILNRKAMEYIINYLDNKYVPIDFTLEDANAKNDLNIYLPKMELSLCIEKKETWSSDIRLYIDKPHQEYMGIKRFNEENYV